MKNFCHVISQKLFKNKIKNFFEPFFARFFDIFMYFLIEIEKRRENLFQNLFLYIATQK